MEHTPKNILIRGIKDKVNTELTKRRILMNMKNLKAF